MIGIVVNYYRKSTVDNRLNAITLTTELCLVMLKNHSLVATVVLVDGSPNPDKQIERTCLSLDVKYIHTGKELTIPQAYNIGWKSLSEPYIGLIANDVLPYDVETITKLYGWLQRSDIGCVFPYLSEGDWRLQNFRFLKWLEKTCEPSFLLLNFIMFKRNILEMVGGVDEGYESGFYDPILLIKTRKLGYRAVLVEGTKMIHVNGLTKVMGESSILHPIVRRDQLKFKEEYSEYYYEPKSNPMEIEIYWPEKFWKWPLSTTISIKTLWWIRKNIPIRFFRSIFTSITLWIEPILTRYPAKHGKCQRKNRIEP